MGVLIGCNMILTFRKLRGNMKICFVPNLKKRQEYTENTTTFDCHQSTEDRQVKREYHWDMYVQKVMEMPHHRALIKTVGLCIDRGMC